MRRYLQCGRRLVVVLVWLVGCVVWVVGGDMGDVRAEVANWTVPPAPPVLLNPEFECKDGYTFGVNPKGEEIHVPNGWTLELLDGTPVVGSTRLLFAKDCDPAKSSAFIERLSGEDSLVILSEDVDTPPVPGKPFDVLLYQDVATLYGAAYSLSGWMISLCGNKSAPFDCPPDNVIIKRIGLDPLGGTDPNAASVVWVENTRNFVDAEGKRVGWQNMSVAAVALHSRMTVFVRMTSPYQFHGNMGFVDAFSLVRAPLARLEPLPLQVEGNQLELTWASRQSDDAAAVVGGAYQLLIDVQARSLPDGEWRDLAVGLTNATSLPFQATCVNHRYAFRVRARTEQSGGGVWPNQRYPGVWSAPQQVFFIGEESAPQPPDVTGPYRLFIPKIDVYSAC